MLCFPNAKINIGLNVTERRPDQFHSIETVFYPIPLSDILEIIVNTASESSDVELKISGMAIAGDKDENLCTRAYRLLNAGYTLPPVKIILHKIIPAGAGLGGGSSDGAYTLKLLNTMFRLGLDTEALKMYAGRLGSDCPFFIDNLPALGKGRGNELSPLSLSLSGYFLVLVKPPVFVDTAEAYAGIMPSMPDIPLGDRIKLPMDRWKEIISNDFEQNIFDKHPEIKEAKALLYKRGALYASMTGSGSAVFGLFEKETGLKDDFPGMFYWGAWI